MSEFITTGLAARRIGVTPRIVIRWCDRNQIAGVRREGPKQIRMIPVDSLEAFLRQRGKTLGLEQRAPLVVFYNVPPETIEVVRGLVDPQLAVSAVAIGRLLAYGSVAFVARMDDLDFGVYIPLFKAVADEFPHVRRILICSEPVRFPLADVIVENSAELQRELYACDNFSRGTECPSSAPSQLDAVAS